MNKGFWKKLKKPIMVLAPMAGVTDAVFRQIVAKYGKPDVLVTEFVSCDGLCSPGRDRLLKDLWFTEPERPIVGQIFGSRPENFARTANLPCELNFDGIDINTGCPDRSVEKQGAGASLINNPELTKRIVRETKRGAGEIPVTIKTRLGYNENVIEEWTRHLLEVEPVVITIHARTRRELSKVPANWDAIATAVDVRNRLGSDALIIGNGDITSVAEARDIAEKTGADGVMIGRGIFGNPWLFNQELADSGVSITDRINVLIEHVSLFDQTFGKMKNFECMKKILQIIPHGSTKR